MIEPKFKIGQKVLLILDDTDMDEFYYIFGHLINTAGVVVGYDIHEGRGVPPRFFYKLDTCKDRGVSFAEESLQAAE